MSFVSKSYFYISFMAFAMVLSQELQENQNQFFQALVSISNRSLPSLTLMNIVAMILFFIWNFITKLVYGNLNEFELDTLFETGYRKLVDFLLIAGMSGYKSTKEGIFIFFILLLLREWNEIANLRFSLILQNPFVPLSQKLRIFFGVVLFMFIDFSLFKLSLNEMTQNFPSIHIIFSIEFLLIVVEVFFLYIRSVFLLISSDKTDELLIYLEPIKELLKFLVMLIAFILLFMGGDIPFNFFQDLILYFKLFRIKLSNMIQFIKITKSLKSEFPSPTQEDLDHDNICIICREEMTISNSCKLPCTHCFHRVCLRRWFKQKRKCPTCDLDLMDK